MANTASVQQRGAPPAAEQNGLIESELLESLQSSIVGLVVIWEEPDAIGYWSATSADPTTGPTGSRLPAMSICTGWFDTPTTIATAGHCVDPKEGRQILDANELSIDPQTGELLPPPVRPEPKRTVIAFQPRELPGAVITAPTTARVDSFRNADEGDTAKLAIDGMPPAPPLTIAAAPPRLGEPITSIGFPALNLGSTDGINLDALLSGGKSLAEVLQDSRLQPVSTSGTIISRQYRDGVGVYQVNSDLDSGESGGPTVNSHGEVYGINSRMTMFGQNFNIITDTGLRESFGPRPEQPTTPNTPANVPASQLGVAPAGADAPGQPVGWIILVTGIGAAILGGAASWLLQRSARRSSITNATDHEEAQLAEKAGHEQSKINAEPTPTSSPT